jgi:succinoglycan biosynthesis protein ExoA
MVEGVVTVIPCLNEEEHIEHLVRQLASSSLSMRIVVADGGSEDRTPQIGQGLAAQFPNVSFLQNPKRVQAAAVNLAAAVYGKNAEFLIRIDAHADYPDDYCQILMDEAEKTGADSVVVGMNTVGKTAVQMAVAAAQNSLLGNGGAAHRRVGATGQWAEHGHHALMRLAAFHAVGGYDETFSHNEDAELDTRLRAAGYKIWQTGKTTLTYYPRSCPVALFRQYMRYGNGRVRHILKHPARPKLRQMLPALVLPAMLLAPLAPFWWVASCPLIVWVAFCLGYGLTLGANAKDLRLTAAGPAAMIMHIGWSVGFWKAMLTEFGKSCGFLRSPNSGWKRLY